MQPVVTIAGTGFDGVHVALFLAVLGLAAALYWLRGRGRDEKRALEAELDQSGAAAERLGDELASTRESLETHREQLGEAEKQLAAAEARFETEQKAFADMARRAVAQAHKTFLENADETFKRHDADARSRLEKLMEPIGKNFAEFKSRVEALEKVRTEDKTAIQEQVKAIGESLMENTRQTNKLVTALSAPKSGGRWGETSLRNVMERAGLSEFCDFTKQTTDTVDGERSRPDVIIRLPGGREIVVDAKVSIDDYLKAIDATDATERAAHLKAHGRNVRNHISKLASKQYQDGFSSRVDFVALFIPGENFYVAALEHEPDLFDYAASKQVIVVTPSTLLALAKAVAYGWRQEQASENARHAAELGRELYARLATMGAHIDNLGKAINKSVEHYNKLGGSLNARVFATARQFETLSIAPPDKEVRDATAIETRAVLPDRSGELDFETPKSKDEAA